MQKIVTSLLCLTCLVLLAGCGKQAGPTLQTKFSTSIPSGVQVKHFEWSGVGMDHWYIWMIEPADPTFVQALVKSASLTRATPTQDADGLGRSWPAWWSVAAIEALPEHYFRHDASKNWHVWVDTKNGRIYIQWFDT